jgi:hypothetical protein
MRRVLLALVLSGFLATEGQALTNPPNRVERSATFARVDQIVAKEPPATTLVAAGDIADCKSPGDEQTAALLDGISGTVAALGDLAYPNGSPANFAFCYDPTWGRFRLRTRPAIGNHEYQTPGAAGYFNYFGSAAGEPGQGWYSYDLGAWHVVVLNANCWQVGGCEPGSPQETWLRADLASHPTRCTLAYWHMPRFSSGEIQGESRYQPFWQALYDANADLVLVGHAHNYQRWAPLDPSGNFDPQRGIREFVVGTGGRGFHRVTPLLHGEELANDDTWGVLRLTLGWKNYTWQFVPVAGRTFTDSGSDLCH